MTAFDDLRSYVDTNISTNGAQGITGAEVNEALNDFIDIINPEDYAAWSTSWNNRKVLVWDMVTGVGLAATPGDVVGGASAAELPFDPYDDIAATNTQAAIEELADSRVDKAGDTMTGQLNGQSGVVRINNIGVGVNTDPTAGGTWPGTFISYESGLSIWRLQSDTASSQIRIDVFSSAAASSQGLISVFRSRGSLASPSAVLQGDRLGSIGYSGRATSSNITACLAYVDITEPSPSNTLFGARWAMDITSVGGATRTEIIRLEHATGLSMFGANPVINQNRHFRARQYAAASLPAQASGDAIASSDVVAAWLVSDGTQWLSPGVKVLNAVTNDTTISIPAGWAIDSIHIANTTANAVTGGIKIGTTSGATDVVAAQAVGANALITIADASILLKIFSRSVAQTLFIQDVTAWNSASLEISFVLKKVF